MANKTLAKRQKLAFRIEPSQKSLKPRNPVAIAAKQRAAGQHRKNASARRQAQKRSLKKILTDADEEKPGARQTPDAVEKPPADRPGAVARPKAVKKLGAVKEPEPAGKPKAAEKSRAAAKPGVVE